MTQSKQENNGCLRIIVPVFLTIIGFAVIRNFIDINYLLALIIAFLGAIFLSYKLLGKPSVSSALITLLAIGLVVVLLFVAKTFLQFIFDIPETKVVNLADENVERETRILNEDSVYLYTSNRVWKDYYGRNYAGPLSVRDSDFQRLRYSQNDFTPLDHLSYWGQLYDLMDKQNTSSLDLVMETFDKIHAEKKLNQMEFAEMVVSCIQDIPYAFVFEEACMPAEYYESSIAKALEICPECCIGNIKYGVQNPVSFMQNLKGDCDTRTVILYAILKYYNYDVAILNSNHYLHSILGLNIPAAGDFKIYNGKKYIVWETTADGYSAGQLPYNMKNLSHWNVVLTSK
ncbi:MAG: hypothetical protein ACI86C_001863 [Candidatus Latescibacterota bacterium]|jgi:hypothetical protein